LHRGHGHGQVFGGAAREGRTACCFSRVFEPWIRPVTSRSELGTAQRADWRWGLRQPQRCERLPPGHRLRTRTAPEPRSRSLG